MALDAFWIAHRGGGVAAPENTLAAFRAGLAAGFRAFECDVQLSRDGVVFLLHDARLERTTVRGRGVAAHRTWMQLRRLEAGAWFAGAGEPLPRLAEVLALAAARRLWLNIEMKPARGRVRRLGTVVARQVLRACRRYPRLPPPLLSSFAPAALRAARAQCRRRGVLLPLALLARHWQADLPGRAQRLGAQALHLHWRAVTPARVRAVAAAGLDLRVYTVNRIDTARRLRALDVAGVFTDRLDLPARLSAPLH